MRRACWLRARNITYEDMRRIVLSKLDGGSPQYRIIDVRSPSEVKSYGQIPHAIIIPIQMLTDVLVVDKDDFSHAYGEELPLPATDCLVFYCQKGVRSLVACDIAEEMGFRVLHYSGGFAEWAAKESLP